MGSTPGDRMNTRGVRGVESSITCQEHRVWPQQKAMQCEWERELEGMHVVHWRGGGGEGGPREEVGDVGKETKPLTNFMFSTGGSMKREPRLETMNEVTQKDTRSWRRERTISIRCISLQVLSHSPGEERVVAGGAWESRDSKPRGTCRECSARRQLAEGSLREGLGNKGTGTHGAEWREGEKQKWGGPNAGAPGSTAFSGVELVYHWCQSRGYCSKEFMSPWKLVSLSSSVMLSQ